MPPVICDAPGADPAMPEGGSSSVTEKPAHKKKLLPENKKPMVREPPAEMALSEKPPIQLPPATRKRKLTIEKTVAKTCHTNGPKTTPRKQVEADDQPEARTTAVRPCFASSRIERLHRGPLSPRLPSNLPHCPLRAPTLGTILHPPCRHHGK